METWVLRCKLYPEQHRGGTLWSARPFRGGGWIPRAIAGLDRWLSKQNPAYRPGRTKSTAGDHSCGAFTFHECILASINKAKNCCLTYQPKPPLCKGRWHGVAVTEGLYRNCFPFRISFSGLISLFCTIPQSKIRDFCQGRKSSKCNTF